MPPPLGNVCSSIPYAYVKHIDETAEVKVSTTNGSALVGYMTALDGLEISDAMTERRARSR
jgi:hypothetical protein